MYSLEPMETKSEKRWKLLPVTDLDIVYIGGVHDTITYGEADSVDENDTEITVLIRDQKTGKNLERLICLKRNMLSFKYRDRLLKIEDKSPLPVLGSVDAPTDGE